MNRAHFLKLIGVAVLGRHIPIPEPKPVPLTATQAQFKYQEYKLGFQVSNELYGELLKPGLARDYARMMGGLK